MAVIVNKYLKILIVLTFVQFSASRSDTSTTATDADYNELWHDRTKRDVWGQPMSRGSYEPMHQQAVPDNGYDDKRPLHDETRYYRNLPENGPETIASSKLLNGPVNKQVASPVASQSVASPLWQPVPPSFSSSANSTIGQPDADSPTGLFGAASPIGQSAASPEAKRQIKPSDTIPSSPGGDGSIDKCSNNPCKNDAICKKDPIKFWKIQCACTREYSGRFCSKVRRDCNNAYCRKADDCFMTPGGPMCICVGTAAWSSIICKMAKGGNIPSSKYVRRGCNEVKCKILENCFLTPGGAMCICASGPSSSTMCKMDNESASNKLNNKNFKPKKTSSNHGSKSSSNHGSKSSSNHGSKSSSNHGSKSSSNHGSKSSSNHGSQSSKKHGSKSSRKHGSKSSDDELADKEDKSDTKTLSGGTIIGIVFGVGVLLFIIILCCCKKGKSTSNEIRDDLTFGAGKDDPFNNMDFIPKKSHDELADKEDALGRMINSKTSVVYGDGARRASQSAIRANRSISNKSQYKIPAHDDDALRRLIKSKTSVVYGDGTRQASQSAIRANRTMSNQSQYGTTPNQSQNNIIDPRTPSRQHLIKRSSQRLPVLKTSPTTQAYTRHKNSSQHLRKISSINKSNGRHTSYVKHPTTETEDSSEDSDSSMSGSETTEKSVMEQVCSSRIEDRQAYAADESFNASLDEEDERSSYVDNGSYQMSRAYREPNSQYHGQNALRIPTGRGKITKQERQPILRLDQSSKRSSQRERTCSTPKISTTPLSERIARLRYVHNQSKDKILIKKSYKQQPRYQIVSSSNEEEIEYARRNQDYIRRKDNPHWNKNMNTNTGYECESSFITKSHVKQPILSKFRLPNNDENFCMNNNVVNEYSDLGIEHVYCDPQCESESLCGKEYLHIDEKKFHASGKCKDIGQADTTKKENTKLIATADTHNDVSRCFNNDEQNIQNANKKENTLDDNKSSNEMYGIFATTITLPSREKENHEDNEENEMLRNNSDFYQRQLEISDPRIIKHDDSSTKLRDKVNTSKKHDFKHYGCVVETVSLAENHKRNEEQGLCEKQVYNSRERHTSSENKDKSSEQHRSSTGTFQSKRHVIAEKGIRDLNNDTISAENENTDNKEEQYIKSYEKDGQMLYYVDDSNDYGNTSNCFDVMNEYSANHTPDFEFTVGTYDMNVTPNSEAGTVTNDFVFSDGSTDSSKTIVAASRSTSFVNDGRLFDNN